MHSLNVENLNSNRSTIIVSQNVWFAFRMVNFSGYFVVDNRMNAFKKMQIGILNFQTFHNAEHLNSC